jgi:hypothetical protein
VAQSHNFHHVIKIVIQVLCNFDGKNIIKDCTLFLVQNIKDHVFSLLQEAFDLHVQIEHEFFGFLYKAQNWLETKKSKELVYIYTNAKLCCDYISDALWYYKFLDSKGLDINIK